MKANKNPKSVQQTHPDIYQEIVDRLEEMRIQCANDIDRYLQLLIFDVLDCQLIPFLKKSGMSKNHQVAKLRKYSKSYFAGMSLKEIRKLLN